MVTPALVKVSSIPELHIGVTVLTAPPPANPTSHNHRPAPELCSLLWPGGGGGCYGGAPTS